MLEWTLPPWWSKHGAKNNNPASIRVISRAFKVGGAAAAIVKRRRQQEQEETRWIMVLFLDEVQIELAYLGWMDEAVDSGASSMCVNQSP
jgi:hypothetical protein